jgi:transposase
LLELLHQTEQQCATTLLAKDAELEIKDTELQVKDDIIKQLEQKNIDWELAYNKLWHERFAARSERYIADPDQLRLDFGDTDEAADAAAGLADAIEEADLIAAHKRRKPRKKRDEGLPEHLPRYEVIVTVPDEMKICSTHGERTLLPESMWDRTETLESEPPQLKVRVTVYQKYACENQPQCGVTSPERPIGIVEGNKYDTSVAAEIITGKFSFHLPIYRQQDYFAGSGWTPSRSTLLNILTNSHFVIEPLLEFFRRTVQDDPIVGCDDTSVTLLYPKTLPQFDLNDPKERRIHEVFMEALNENKPSIRAKMWAYRGQTIPLNVFDFTVSRHRDGPELFFANYQGTLLGDCWHGFESIVSNSSGAIVRAACNSHARRKIDETTSYPDDRLLWLNGYQKLYDIETRGKTMSAEERLSLRQAEAKPIWDAMEAWLVEIKLRTSNVVLPKSDFGKALQYIRNHFAELKLYLENPLLPMDNNDTEQLMKQVAIGRKNWLFAGSVAAGERSAGFMTLVSSALRNDLSVWHYVKDVLDRVLSGETDYEPLLPWNWATQHPEAIRTYRIKERRDRDDRKQSRRAERRRQQQRQKK